MWLGFFVFWFLVFFFCSVSGFKLFGFVWIFCWVFVWFWRVFVVLWVFGGFCCFCLLLIWFGFCFGFRFYWYLGFTIAGGFLMVGSVFGLHTS